MESFEGRVVDAKVPAEMQLQTSFAASVKPIVAAEELTAVVITTARQPTTTSKGIAIRLAFGQPRPLVGKPFTRQPIAAIIIIVISTSKPIIAAISIIDSRPSQFKIVTIPKEFIIAEGALTFTEANIPICSLEYSEKAAFQSTYFSFGSI
jgi:hypothetical protein